MEGVGCAEEGTAVGLMPPISCSILQTLLENQFLSDTFKKSLLEAGQVGHTLPGACDQFVCSKQVLHLPPEGSVVAYFICTILFSTHCNITGVNYYFNFRYPIFPQ
jgi:hypothetical protein